MTGIIETMGLWGLLGINFANNVINTADSLGAIGVDALMILGIVLLVKFFLDLFRKPKGDKK